MCFGNEKTGSSVTTNTVDPALQSASTQNLNFAQGLQSKGYQAYGGERVADFSPLQTGAFNLAATAGDPNAYLPEIQQAYRDYGSAPGQSVQADTIANNMQPYLNQYVGYALAPQIAAQEKQFNDQWKQHQSTATSSNAFGDARAGIESGALTNAQNMGRTGLIGNAYNAAFNTAIGAGAQDVSNKMQAQRDTGTFAEQALARKLGGGTALNQLDASQLQRLMQSIGVMGQAGAQQQAQKQAKLNVPYSDYLAGQQYDFLTSQLMNSAIGAAKGATNSTSTTDKYAPNNSGWALAGAALPVLAAPFTGGASLAALPAMSAGAMGGTGGGLGGLYEDGGRPPVGQPSIVGEGGPELFVPDSSGVVIPNEILEAIRAKRAGKSNPLLDALSAAIGKAA